MYFTASIQVYDALTEVVWVGQVREWSEDGTDGPSRVVYRLAGTVPGEGLGDPTRWLRGVLEAIRESM